VSGAKALVGCCLCVAVAEALVAIRRTLTVWVVGLETGESITFKRKRRLNLRVLDGWVIVEILQFSVDRELGESDRGLHSWRCPRLESAAVGPPAWLFPDVDASSD
jgi:hypothetical protein